ncbi:hypothetical protein GWK47_007677 [Chionoecetes opilio]|uniref:UPAR/Ly6 domain-containing protein n=1 Tax=Chionoecetes opilio TaxID=41210 RepID=A0A8J5CQ46_CHIOP|nr:hypothetical protein GWK47_007677 [Chionoecetes opilio]
MNTPARLLLLALTTLALFHAAASFMCYTKTVGKDDSSVAFCSSGTCFSIGGSVLDDNKDGQKGCAEESHDSGCTEAGIPGLISAHTCFCSTPLCNTAYTPTIILPLLLLPAVLQRLL